MRSISKQAKNTGLEILRFVKEPFSHYESLQERQDVMLEILQGELIYIWYYFDIQLRQIFVYWVLRMVIGSLVSADITNFTHLNYP